MFTPLHSSTNKQKLFEKYVCKHCEKYDGAACPSYCLKVKYPSLSAMFNSLHSSTHQELFEKLLRDQGSHYEKYRQFPLCKGSHHVQPPNQHPPLSVKMNGTQRRVLVRPGRMHYVYCGMPKGTSQAEVTSNSEKVMLVALADIEVCLSEGISQSEENSII